MFVFLPPIPPPSQLHCLCVGIRVVPLRPDGVIDPPGNQMPSQSLQFSVFWQRKREETVRKKGRGVEVSLRYPRTGSQWPPPSVDVIDECDATSQSLTLCTLCK